jgi:hypothetical protein
MIRSNSVVIDYLTPEATELLKDLKNLGFDEDLALTLIEELGGEKIWEIPPPCVEGDTYE